MNIGRGAEEQNSDQQNKRAQEKKRQGKLAQAFYAAADSVINDSNIEKKGNEEKQICPPRAVKEGIILQPLETAQERLHGSLVRQSRIFAEKREKTIGQRPGFNISIVNKNNQRTEDADYAKIFDKPVFLQKTMKYPRRSAVFKTAAIAAERPFNPH